MTKPKSPTKPRKPRTKPTEPNPFEGTVAAARSAYDSTKAKDTRDSQGTRDSQDTREPQGTQTMPQLPSRARALLDSIPPEARILYARHASAGGTRASALNKAWPAAGRENDATKGAVVAALDADPLVIAERASLAKATADAQLLSMTERRKICADIARSGEHPMRGFTDPLKAIELDARLTKELGGAGSGETTNHVAAINLFFLPSSAVAPLAVGQQPRGCNLPTNEQVVVDV